jgi:apolipoprotein D and lipocalin family protein
MIRLGFTALISCMMIGCTEELPLETVPQVEIHRYMGTWYEIASFPAWFQKDCTGTTATYSLNTDATVKVLNRCFKKTLRGSEDHAEGSAFIEDTSTNAKLKVTFFWPFYGKYWIIELAEDYSYAVVGHPNRNYLWILSRTPKMSPHLYDSLLSRIVKKGFDISKLNKTLQPN